jgi:hypothetical protein
MYCFLFSALFTKKNKKVAVFFVIHYVEKKKKTKRKLTDRPTCIYMFQCYLFFVLKAEVNKQVPKPTFFPEIQGR